MAINCTFQTIHSIQVQLGILVSCLIFGQHNTEEKRGAIVIQCLMGSSVVDAAVTSAPLSKDEGAVSLSLSVLFFASTLCSCFHTLQLLLCGPSCHKTS